MNLRALLFPAAPETPGSVGRLLLRVLFVSALIMLGGPGRFSIDAVIRSRLGLLRS